MDGNALEAAQIPEINQSQKRKFTLSKKIILFFAFLIILLIAVFLYFLIFHKRTASIEKQSAPIVRVKAPEVVQKSINFLLPKERFIYHEKTKEYADGSNVPITTELWIDSDSGRFLKKVINQDGIEIWQGYDGSTSWQEDFQEKTFIIETNKNKDGSSVNFDGQKIELAGSLHNLLEQGKLDAKEEAINGKKVYVVTDIREKDKDWDVLIFDKETLKLLSTEKYDGEGKNKVLIDKVDYDIQEFIERTDENINKIFSYSIPAGFKVINNSDASESAVLNP